MFDRGISNDKFVDALTQWQHWQEIVSDRDLFVAIRQYGKNVAIYIITDV
jgi:hypothetical protein